MSKYIPVLTIAGSDPSGGAGIQADLKTFSALECYGMSVITALTAQNTVGVQGIYNIPPEFIFEQIKSVFEDIEVQAVKLGMLSNAETIHTVARALKTFNARNIVLDPVMVSKSGHALLDPSAIEALREELVPLATIVTPNIPEAEKLVGCSIQSRKEMENVANKILDLGCESIVLKGGHLGTIESPDLLLEKEGSPIWIEAPRVSTQNTHGTGCTFASAVAAFLAKGFVTREAALAAKKYLHHAIEKGKGMKLGKGQGPVCHY